MENELPRKPYVVSEEFNESRESIYEYTLDTFYPECRHLATKSRMYRNIILDAHLIIYRITDVRIEVLDIIHSASSIGKIRNTRKIRL